MKQTDISALKVIAVLVLLATAADSVRLAWGTYNWVGEFFEYFVAGLLWLVVILGMPALAAIAGVYTARYSDRNWLGWLTGILICLVLWYFLPDIFEQIPGVGWKLEERLSP